MPDYRCGRLRPFGPVAIMSLRRCSLAFAAILLVVAPATRAWGPLGHRVVAELAQRHLGPAAGAELERLLAAEHTTQLADVAGWPDQIQNDPAQATLWQQTRKLHYVNFRGGPGCDYEPPRDCRNGACIVAGLRRYVAILGDKAQSDAARLEALKFVVHFAGDIHQPLHAGYRDDLGGNRYQVQFEGKGSNLHRVWDTGMLETRGLGWQAYAAKLDAEGLAPLPPPIAPLDDPYAPWARESCHATAAPGFYPDGHRIGQAYVDAELPVAENQLRIGGRRLAAVLNLALTPR